MNAKVLILDDSQERHDIFDMKLEGELLTHVFTHEEAVKALEAQTPKTLFDCVYLDHDLGTDPVTGFNTARFIAESLPKELHPRIVVVHSCNSVRAPLMVETIERAGILSRWEMFRI